MAMSVQTSISTNPAIGYVGQLDSGANDITSGKNVEASASIPFGYAVIFKSGGTTDADALLPSAETDKVMGIVIHGHNYARAWTDSNGTVHGELDSTGLRPGTMMNVLRKGRILVTAEDAVVPGDRLWVRCTAGGAGEVVGGLTNADESTETIDCTGQGVWKSTAAAGALAWLEVDFTNKPT